ncbi:hypothetical protein KC19_VG021600 [Ceratodon purpureus]|uniref:Uncharacterized protein n=1 Tax=Ceratodon purpureus TaxID=3225 RepID=A0A8T0HL95_CERPU|nr:hypothetical protein KC19_VG021600 [Ceratodon purpureus]
MHPECPKDKHPALLAWWASPGGGGGSSKSHRMKELNAARATRRQAENIAIGSIRGIMGSFRVSNVLLRSSTPALPVMSGQEMSRSDGASPFPVGEVDMADPNDDGSIPTEDIPEHVEEVRDLMVVLKCFFFFFFFSFLNIGKILYPYLV